MENLENRHQTPLNSKWFIIIIITIIVWLKYVKKILNLLGPVQKYIWEYNS